MLSILDTIEYMLDLDFHLELEGDNSYHNLINRSKGFEYMEDL